MRGIILAGGSAQRLRPLSTVINKHLLPIGRYPMIYYPLETLISCGIKDIMVVTGHDHAGQFVNLLGDGSDFGVNIVYSYQKKPLGIADALRRAECFVGNDEQFITILGDNVFMEPLYLNVKDGCESKIFLKEVAHPEHYGVVNFNPDHSIKNIEEKPKHPKSSIIATGAYLYPNRVFPLINELSPSERGELEISHLNNMFIDNGTMDYQILSEEWFDCGESLEEYGETSYTMRGIILKYLTEIKK